MMLKLPLEQSDSPFRCLSSQQLSCFDNKSDSFDEDGSEVSTPAAKRFQLYAPVTPVYPLRYDNSMSEDEQPSNRFITECREDGQGEMVYLHLYDLTDALGHLNSVALDLLGICGALHVGVEVLGNEWSFGTQGVSVAAPKHNQYYTYRQSVRMGRTRLKRKEVQHTILVLKRKWAGVHYEIFTQNCGTFCNELCERLGVGRMPPWVTRLAETMAVVPAARTLAEVITRASMPDESLPGSPVQDPWDEDESRSEVGVAGLRQSVPEPLSGSPVRCHIASGDAGQAPLPQTRCASFRIHEGRDSARTAVGHRSQPQIADKFGGRRCQEQIMRAAAGGGG